MCLVVYVWLFFRQQGHWDCQISVSCFQTTTLIGREQTRAFSWRRPTEGWTVGGVTEFCCGEKHAFLCDTIRHSFLGRCDPFSTPVHVVVLPVSCRFFTLARRQDPCCAFAFSRRLCAVVRAGVGRPKRKSSEGNATGVGCCCCDSLSFSVGCNLSCLSAVCSFFLTDGLVAIPCVKRWNMRWFPPQADWSLWGVLSTGKANLIFRSKFLIDASIQRPRYSLIISDFSHYTFLWSMLYEVLFTFARVAPSAYVFFCVCVTPSLRKCFVPTGFVAIALLLFACCPSCLHPRAKGVSVLGTLTSRSSCRSQRWVRVQCSDTFKTLLVCIWHRRCRRLTLCRGETAAICLHLEALDTG